MKLGGYTFSILLAISQVFSPASTIDCQSLSSDCECGDCCFKVEENAPWGTYLGQLGDVPNAKLGNDSQDLTYQFTCASFPFHIVNSTTGAFQTAISFDREQLNKTCENNVNEVSCFTAFAQVSDSTRSLSFDFYVDVTDLNDNKPQFLHTIATGMSSFTQTVEERKTLEQLFCSDQLTAKDKDEGANSEVSYSVVSSPKQFDIHLLNNKLCVDNLVELDRETNSSISFVLKAEDMGVPTNLSSELTVVLELTDDNDNPPIFIDPQLMLSVPENVSIGSVIARYMATDLDIGSNGLITYSLSSTVDVPFYLDSSNGTLYLDGKLDADKPPDTYSFLIQATDQGSPKSSSEVLTITVSIENVNDNPPGPVTFTGNGQNITQAEGNVLGTITTFTVVDVDVSDLTGFITSGGDYATLGKPNSLTPSTYLFFLTYKVDELDYESVQNIIVEFTISDGGSPELKTSSFVTINVTDVNDNAPYLTKTMFEVEEEKFKQGSFLQFSLKGYFNDSDSSFNNSNKPGDFAAAAADEEELIEVDAGGSLKVSGRLDREAVSDGMITFKVIVRDRGYPSLSSTETIHLKLLDINDNAPIFDDSQTETFYIYENQPTVANFGRVNANDKDEGLNATITYKLVNSTHFFIDNVTGNLSSIAELDREEKGFYTLTVIAEDLGTPPMSAKRQITVIILDVNDNPPEFVNITTQFNVDANAHIGTFVGKINAVDKDNGTNAEFSYELDNTTFFKITGDGTIETAQQLAGLVDMQVYKLFVKVFNINDTNMSSNTSVQIIVVRDNRTNADRFDDILIYTVISGAFVVLVVAILIVLCCICCLCYYRHRCQSKNLLPVPPLNGTLQKKSSLKDPSTNREATPAHGEVPRSPTVLFSDEYQVRYFSQDQSMSKSTCLKTETVRLDETVGSETIESPQIPTKEIPEVEEVSSPPLSEDLSSNSSLSNSIYNPPYYNNPPMPLREDVLKKHNEACSENYGSRKMLYTPQGTNQHDRLYPMDGYVGNNSHYSPAMVEDQSDDNRDDEFDGVDTLPPNIQQYLSSNHQSNQSISAPVSHYVSQNGTPPSMDSSPRIFIHQHPPPNGHNNLQLHKSLPAVYYMAQAPPPPPPPPTGMSSHNHYALDPAYYEDPPPRKNGMRHYSSSSSSSSSAHHIHHSDIPPHPPPQQAHYLPHPHPHPHPHQIHYPHLSRHGIHSRDPPSRNGHLSPLDEYHQHIVGHMTRTHEGYQHHLLHPLTHDFETSHQSFEDNDTVASSVLDNYLQFEGQLKPYYDPLSYASSVDEQG